jgi:hypothetical protein
LTLEAVEKADYDYDYDSDSDFCLTGGSHCDCAGFFSPSHFPPQLRIPTGILPAGRFLLSAKSVKLLRRCEPTFGAAPRMRRITLPGYTVDGLPQPEAPPMPAISSPPFAPASSASWGNPSSYATQ